MNRLFLVWCGGFILLILGLVSINSTLLRPMSLDTPQVVLYASEYEDITTKETKYKDERVRQPLVDNMRVNMLIQSDFDQVVQKHKDINYSIPHKNESYLSLLIAADDQQYPITYSLSDESRVELSDVFEEGAIVRNIISHPYQKDDFRPSFVIRDDQLVTYTTRGEKRNLPLSDVSKFLNLSVLEDLHPKTATIEFNKREDKKLAQQLARRIEKQQKALEDDVNCAVIRCVSLTFDDGPSPYTETLLDILKKRSAKATFYTLGQQIAKYPEISKRIVQEGHTIGNHTYHHPDLNSIEEPEVFEEITKTQNIIYNTTGQYPLTYRPPYGSSRSLTSKYPLDEILWNVDTKDWEHKDTNRTIELATTDIPNGSIILLHDIHESTINAIPAIIDSLRNQGFTIVTVEDLLANGTLYEPNGATVRSSTEIEFNN